MRTRILFLASVLSCLAPLPTRAQVSVDPRALDQLKPPDATPPDPSAKPTARTTPTPARASRQPTPPKPAAAVAASIDPGKIYGPPRPPPPTTIPAAPPPLPVVPPPIPVPTRAPPPPRPVPIVADAPGQAIRQPDGLRITFGAGRADFNAATDSALRNLVRALAPFDTTVFTLLASATPQADDPSTPRRLALSRALAIRDIMLTEGVTSPRIIVKVAAAADGRTANGPPDRVDVLATTTQPAAPAPSASGSKP